MSKKKSSPRKGEQLSIPGSAPEPKPEQSPSSYQSMMESAQQLLARAAQTNEQAARAAAARDALAAARDAAALSQPDLMERCLALASVVLPPLHKQQPIDLE